MSGWSRTTWCLAILMTVAFVLIGRLAQLQVFDTFDLEKKNLLQVQVDRKLQSPRGTIYDRNGKPLAMSVVTKSLYADPKMIKQSPQEIAELISPYVTMSKENIVKALQEDSAFVWINRMMDADKSKAVAQVIKDVYKRQWSTCSIRGVRKIFEKVFICCSSYRNCIIFTLYFQM